MFEKNVLLELKRRYSKDEAVQFIQKQLESAMIKNGKLISEIDELKFEIEKLRQIPTSNGKTKRQWLQDEIFIDISNENKKNKQLIQKLHTEINELKRKNIQLLIKINNITK